MGGVLVIAPSALVMMICMGLTLMIIGVAVGFVFALMREQDTLLKDYEPWMVHTRKMRRVPGVPLRTHATTQHAGLQLVSAPTQAGIICTRCHQQRRTLRNVDGQYICNSCYQVMEWARNRVRV